MTFGDTFPLYFQRTYSVFYKKKFICYSLCCVYRLFLELFCVLHQLHHQKQVHLEDVPHAQKMESARSQVTGPLCVVLCFEKYHAEIDRIS